jgi:hypothetical protein
MRQMYCGELDEKLFESIDINDTMFIQKRNATLYLFHLCKFVNGTIRIS